MFLVCGEALYDVFTGQASPDGGLSLDAKPGGSPFNVAIGLARLGSSVGFFGGLSRDILGERLLERLQAEGVDTAFIVRSDRATTLSLVGANPDGTPAYTFYGTSAADRDLTRGDLPNVPATIKGLHFGSYALVAEPAADALFALAEREAGARLISLDPNVRPAIEPDMRVWRRRIAAIAERSDVIKASVEDMAQVWPGDQPDAIARRWLAQGAALVIVTLGAQGAIAYTAEHVVPIAAAETRIVDTVGAGDAFQAALLNGLRSLDVTSRAHVAAMERGQIEALLGYANCAAAFACARRGANLPRAAELGSPPRP